ncbi:MAG: MBL fold metallo-hydrolase [Candidatus Aenigmarchaeota archaeon]|nr:MBL fold metallo-hydrolase [Candidatus Aenigmarchaeota archaeon]
MKMADDIILLGGAEIDSNIYCIGNELLVDFGSGVFFPEVLDQIKRNGIKLVGIQTMVLTHSHAEHSGGASPFQQRLQAKLFCHPLAIEALKNNESARELELDKYKPPKVDGTLKDGETVKAGRYNFKVIYTPGHSKDSICLWEEEAKVIRHRDALARPRVACKQHKSLRKERHQGPACWNKVIFMGNFGELVARLFATGRLSGSRIEFEGGAAEGKDVLGIADGTVLLDGGEKIPLEKIRRVWLKGKKNIRK